jgi:hypothetical protein
MAPITAAQRSCTVLDFMMTTDPKQIVILGSGVAGVYTARYLEKLLRPEQASITLINRENYWVYQPILLEVISGSISLTNVVFTHSAPMPRASIAPCYDRLSFIVQSLLQAACIFLVAGRLARQF